MARDQVDMSFRPSSEGFAEQLQPQASPVSTYAQPATPEPSQLHGLAQALSNFSHDIGGFLDKRQTKLDDADKVRGQAEALKNNGVGYAEAVRGGKLATYNSPVFVQSYKEAQGSILGKKLAAGAVDAYQTWGGRNSQDPNDFDKFLGGYIKQNLSTDDPDILKGALPYVHSASDALYTANEKERSDNLYNNSLNAHIASSAMNIDNEQDVSIAQARSTNYDTMWQGLMADRQTALASGIRADDYDKSMQAMITSKALEHMDPAMLGMLKNKVPGQNYTYADTLEGQKAINQTMDTLTSRQAQVDRLKAEQQKAADTVQQDKNTAFAIGELSKNPNAVFDPKFIENAAKLDPKFQVELKTWAADLAKGAPEDPQEIMAIQERILNGAGAGIISENLGPGGSIHDPATLASLNNLANSVSGKDMAPILQNQGVKDSLDYLRQTLVSTDLFANPSGLTPDAIQARSDFLQSMYSWSAAHPQARYDEINSQANKVLKEMTTGINASKYARPDAITQEMAQPPKMDANGERNTDQTPKPVADTPLVDTKQTSDANAVKPNDDPRQAPWRQEKPPTLDQLEPSQQQKVNERAAALGVDPQKIIDEIHAAGRGQFLRAPGQTGTKEGAAYVTPSMPNPKGMVEAGNINLSDRNSRVDNGDGSYSTVATIGVQDGGKEVVIPTIIPDGNGGWKKATNQEAEDYYHTTGQNFGKFNSPAEADAYAEALHNDQAQQYGGQVTTGDQSMNSQDANVGHVKPVVDLIGKTEGTDRGRGYDETIGYGRFDPKSPKKLSQMTIGEVKTFQNGLVSNGAPSGAVGRYQIINKTLKGLQQEMGLSDNDVFTPQVQDQMMMHLLNRRGLQQWLSGKMKDSTFMNGLSKEWASLPNSAGNGSYTGQRVGTTAANLLNVLQQVKQQHQAKPQQV